MLSCLAVTETLMAIGDLDHCGIVVLLTPAIIIISSTTITITSVTISHISTIITVVVVAVHLSICLSVSLSLSTQSVKADGRPPTARFCSRFLPIKGEFFLAAVAKCLLMGELLGLCKLQYGLDLLCMESVMR